MNTRRWGIGAVSVVVSQSLPSDPKGSHPSHTPDTTLGLAFSFAHTEKGRGVAEPGGLCLTSPPLPVTVEMVAEPENTVIVSLILRLGPRDGEGGFVPRDGSREATRDPRGPAVCVVDERAGSLPWGLLVPAWVVTTRD